MIDLAPMTLALAAGGLSVVNPCGFAMLPAYLSFFVGADDDQLPSASTRVALGLKTGLLVTAGFLAVFAIVGIPLTYGATRVVRGVPLAGIAVGVILVGVGVATVRGRGIAVTFANPVRVGGSRGPRTVFTFGIGYGIASLGCTLPVFLAVVGASLATGGTGAALVVLAAYGLGMSVMLIVLSAGAALFRDGVVRTVRRLLPHMPTITGSLLVVAGLYLTYFWVRVRFGSAETLGEDPIVGFVGGFTSAVERIAAANGRLIVAVAAVAVVMIVAASLWNGAVETDPDEPAVRPQGDDHVADRT